jgi:hypothetical protein
MHQQLTDEILESIAERLEFVKEDFFSSPTLRYSPIGLQALVDDYKAIVKQVTGRDIRVRLTITHEEKLRAATLGIPFYKPTVLQVSRGLIETKSAQKVRGIFIHEAGHLLPYQALFIPLKTLFLFSLPDTPLGVGVAAKWLLLANIIHSHICERHNDSIAARREPWGFYLAMLQLYRENPSERLPMIITGQPSLRSRVRKAQKEIIRQRLESRGVPMPKAPIWRMRPCRKDNAKH